MSIATRITSMEEHIEQAYDELQGLGADLTNVNKNIENISMVLDDIYDSMPQVSGEGTSLTLDDTRVGKIKSTLKGNTSQSGTPTPTSPIPINVVSGDNEINVCGKNLWYDIPDRYSHQGVTLTKADDGGYVLNGTTTGVAIFNFNLPVPIEQGTYVLSINASANIPNNVFLRARDSNMAMVTSQSQVQGNNTTSNSSSFTCTTDIYTLALNLTTSGVTYNNLKIYPMIEKGSTASEYSPYQGNTYNVDLPVENLFDTSLLPMTKNGVTISKDDEGNVVLNGTPTITSGYIGFDFTLSSTHLKAGTYTSSIKNKIGGIGITINQTTPGGILNLTMSDTVNSKTGTLTADLIDVTIGVNVRYDVGTLTNFILNPQLEIGSKAHKYTPYGTTPIELCKIGNYQDYFYKGEGYNLLPNNATTQTINGVTFKVNADKSVTLNGTASAIADFYMYGSSTDTGEYLYIPKGTYSISTPSTGWFYIGREKTLGAVVGNSALLNALSSQDCYFYGFIIRATSGSSFSNLTLFPMINEGSTALPYEPYGSKGKWLLHKEIGKSDLKDEGMVLQSINDYGIANFLVQPLETNVPNSSKIENSLCNRFSRQTTGIAQTQTEGFLRTLNVGIGQLGVYIRISSDKANTVETFKTWLENNSTYYYWALYTPTTTEITYQPLIDQLNLLEKAMSKDGQTNISQVNNDLPFIISASALKEWQESTSLNSTLSMVNPLSLGNTLNTQKNNTQPIEADNIEPLEEEEYE